MTNKINKLLLKNAKKTALSFCAGLIMFFSVRPILVFAARETVESTVDFDSENVKVKAELKDSSKEDEDSANTDFRVISYTLDSKEYIVSNENITSTDPDFDNDLIVWQSLVDQFWQIFIHNATTDDTVQLTRIGNNVNPKISGNTVVWESHIEGVWQVMLFDGTRTLQITKGDDPVQGVAIEGDFVAYSKKTGPNDGWQVYMYEISAKREVLLTQGYNAASPKVIGNDIYWIAILDGFEIGMKYDTTSKEVFVLSLNDSLRIFNLGYTVTESTQSIIEALSTGTANVYESTTSIQVVPGDALLTQTTSDGQLLITTLPGSALDGGTSPSGIVLNSDSEPATIDLPVENPTDTQIGIPADTDLNPDVVEDIPINTGSQPSGTTSQDFPAQDEIDGQVEQTEGESVLGAASQGDSSSNGSQEVSGEDLTIQQVTEQDIMDELGVNESTESAK